MRVCTVSRDPFARFDVVREREDSFGWSCTWCGKESARLYRSGIEHDDRPGRIAWDERQFCSIGCRRSYSD